MRSVEGSFSTIKACTERTLEKACASSYVQQQAVDQVTSLLTRLVQLYDASALEEQCARVKTWAKLIVRQGFVAKVEQLRTKQEKERCHQGALESAQAGHEAMDARSFVVALQLEAAGLKRLTAEDKQRGKPVLGVGVAFVARRRTCSKPHDSKVRPNSGKIPGVLRAQTLRTSRHNSLTSKSVRSGSRMSLKSTSRTSQRSAKSKASVNSRASGRAKSAGGTARVKAKVVSRQQQRLVAVATVGKTPGSKKSKATRAAEIQVDQWRKQAQAQTSLLLAQRHRHRYGCLLSDTGKRVRWSTLARQSTAESCALCQRR